MKAVKAYFKKGQVVLAEAAPIGQEAEVLVVFPEASLPDPAERGFPLRELREVVGLLSLGGDAVQGSDALYDP